MVVAFVPPAGDRAAPARRSGVGLGVGRRASGVGSGDGGTTTTSVRGRTSATVGGDGHGGDRGLRRHERDAGRERAAAPPAAAGRPAGRAAGRRPSPARTASTTDSAASSGDSSRAGGCAAATSRRDPRRPPAADRGRACGSRRCARSSTGAGRRARAARQAQHGQVVERVGAGRRGGPRSSTCSVAARPSEGGGDRRAAAGRTRRAAARRGAAARAGRRAPTAAPAAGRRRQRRRRPATWRPEACASANHRPDRLVGGAGLGGAALDQREGRRADDLDGVGRGAAGAQDGVVDAVEVHAHRRDGPVGRQRRRRSPSRSRSATSTA
jgi:hypothetical protein